MFGVFIVIWSMMYNEHTYIHKYIHAVHPIEPKGLLMEAAEGFGLSMEVQTRTQMLADFQIKSMHIAYTIHMLHSARYVCFVC